MVLWDKISQKHKKFCWCHYFDVNMMSSTWLSPRIFQGGKIYCYANFSIVFGPNFGEGTKISEGGVLPPPPPPPMEESQLSSFRYHSRSKFELPYLLSNLAQHWLVQGSIWTKNFNMNTISDFPRYFQLREAVNFTLAVYFTVCCILYAIIFNY